MAAAVLTIDINARLASLEDAVRSTNKSLLSIGDAAKKSTSIAGEAFKGLVSGFTQALTLHALNDQFKSTTESLAELADRAKKTGTSTEGLSALGYAARQSGVDAEGLDKLLGKLNQSVFAAETGNKKAAAAFQTLGISVKSIDTAHPEKTFTDIDTGLSKIEDGSIKAGLAAVIFGSKSGASFQQFGGEVKALTEEAEELGLVISTKTGNQAKEFEDRLDRLKAASEGFKNQLVANALPTLNAFASELITGKGIVHDLRGEIVSFTSDNGLFTFLSEGILLFARIGDTITNVVSTVKNLKSAFEEAAINQAEFFAKLKIQADNFQLGSAEEGFGQDPQLIDKAARETASVTAKYDAERQRLYAGSLADIKNETVLTDKAITFLNGVRKKLDNPIIQNGLRKGKSVADDFVKNGGGDAVAKKDPFEGFVTGLGGDSAKLGFDIKNFDQYKGAADTSKRALVDFELELGKFSDAARSRDGLPVLTAAQKDNARAIADTIVKQAEQLRQLKALSDFDDGIKKIQTDTALLNADNVTRETAIRLLELEKVGLRAGTEEYDKRKASITAALTAQRQANEDRDVRSFSFQGNLNVSDISSQIALIGKNKAAIEALTTARQVDLNIVRATTNEDGSLKVTQETYDNYVKAGEAIKATTISALADLRKESQTASAGAKTFFAEYTDAANDLATQVKGTLSNAFSNLEDQFVTFAQTGKFNFKGLVDSINADLLRIAFKQLTAKGLSELGSALGIDLKGIGGAAGGAAASGAGSAASAASSTAASTATATAFSTAVDAAGVSFSAAADTAGVAFGTASEGAGAAFAVSLEGGGAAFLATVEAAGVAFAASAASGKAIGAIAGAAGSANGNVFAGGSMIPFATGGIVSRATLFPMSGGKTGLMGEAGPEAIVPLKRGADGKLGIAGGGGSYSKVTNITVQYQPAPGESRQTTSQRGAELYRQGLLAAKRNS